MSLQEFLGWLAESGVGAGSGVFAYLIIRYLKFSVTVKGRVYRFDLEALSPLNKRWLGTLLPAVITGAAFGASVGLGYMPSPADKQAWLEILFQVAFAPIVTQITHGQVELRLPKKELSLVDFE